MIHLMQTLAAILGWAVIGIGLGVLTVAVILVAMWVVCLLVVCGSILIWGEGDEREYF